MGVPLPDEQLLRVHGDAVAVIEVVAVENPSATQGAPPRLELRALATLRGTVPAAPFRALWAPASDPFYSMRSGPEEHARWLAQPMPSPAVGERFIVVLEGPGESSPAGPGPVPPGADPLAGQALPWRVSPRPRFAHDAAREQWARQVLGTHG